MSFFTRQEPEFAMHPPELSTSSTSRPSRAEAFNSIFGQAPAGRIATDHNGLGINHGGRHIEPPPYVAEQPQIMQQRPPPPPVSQMQPPYPPQVPNSPSTITSHGYSRQRGMNGTNGSASPTGSYFSFRQVSSSSLLSKNSAPPPALNQDSFRSKSMASMPRNPITAGTSTTAQGRFIPKPVSKDDARTMSLTTDNSRLQTMSGRIIPQRRKQSDPSDTNRTPSSASTCTLNETRPSIAKLTGSSHSTIVTASKRQPLVYPALLSLVAETVKSRMIVGERNKNELAYQDAFNGADVVDVISYIIKTTDRNLALLLGRSLDAQKFLHDVTYDHRLRDHPSEVYQFGSGEDVNGVFTLLTECYSPTCTRDQLCYSIACPRRLEQQARLNMKPVPGLKRAESHASLHDDEEQKLWIHTVAPEVADSCSEQEKKRQEVICEVIYTERDFVKDLEYLRDFWMKPLRSHQCLSDAKREKFIRTVFSNVLEVLAVNSRLAEALTRRQSEASVVRNIGDVFLEHVRNFEPFLKYGANQLYGKYEFEREKSSNDRFARFVEDVERAKESRKLELNGYLTKPTTRLARYPLLLEAVLKNTSDDNRDTKDLPKVIEIIRDLLTRLNMESGKAENHFNLMQLNTQLSFRADERTDLKLLEEGRSLIYKGSLKKSEAGGGDLQCFLFDHVFLLVRIKLANKREQYRVYRKPIPLELLMITSAGEDFGPRTSSLVKRPSSSLLSSSAKSNTIGGMSIPVPRRAEKTEQGYAMTLAHLGRRGYEITLYSSTHVGRRKWVEHIESQKKILRDKSAIFNKEILNSRFFSGGNRVNCLVPIDGGRKLVYGTDSGVYVSDRKPKEGQKLAPVRVLQLSNVTQLDVLEEYAIVLVLSEKALLSYPLESLDPSDTTLANRRSKKIAGHTDFFRAGVCLGRVLVCIVKIRTTQSTIKVLEPADNLARNKRQPALRKLLQGGGEALKVFQEFYIPTESSSIHFLKSNLCVGCAKGFEVVSLETLETQSLLDPADTSLDFVSRRESGLKPIAIYRLNGDFLLNYSEFSFFVNRNGWRARPDWLITWEGLPQAFALSYPFILAFEPSFVEIRHVETGALVHVGTAPRMRMLHESTREVKFIFKIRTNFKILYAYEDESGYDVVASMDFWENQKKAAGRQA